MLISAGRRCSFLRQPETPSFCVTDVVFVLLCLLFSLAACQGTLLLSPLGCGIDSDLQNYAQIMEYLRDPRAMAADPIARLFPQDPGVPNTLTLLAGLFTGAPNAGVAIIRAGAFALWLQLAAWYALGRFLFGRPSLAVVLSLTASITFYWGYGTFWGATHAEPVPRSFFNAALAVYLMLACPALGRAALRPLLCLLIGCGMFIHSVSTLMCGAMFLTAFFLLPARNAQGRFSMAGHLLNTLACVALYCLPVLLFLVLRAPLAGISPADLPLWNDVFAMRFANDYFPSIWTGLSTSLLHYTVDIPVIPAGVAAYGVMFALRDRLGPRCRDMLVLLPALAAGMTAGCLAVCLEVHLAGVLGRMQMSHEMLRATRLLVPMCLICVVCAISPLWLSLSRPAAGALALLGAAALCLVSQDMQVVAARHMVTQVLSLPAEEAARKVLAVRSDEFGALQAIQEQVPADAVVFSPDDAMSVRYVLRHPLHPVHKDGNILYHTRSREQAAQWLADQQALRADGRNVPDVWKSSGTRWMLLRRGHLKDCPGLTSLPGVRVRYENSRWLLLERL